MVAPISLRTALLALLSIPLVWAQDLTSEGCVDPTGFNTCNDKVTDSTAKCIDVCAGNDICILGCGCAESSDRITCAATSCWNRVYTCEYQSLAIQYLDTCPVASGDIPYFPPPDNAPGGCSCNIGKVYNEVILSFLEETSCISNATNSGTFLTTAGAVDTACGCCGISLALSSILQQCPDTDPSLIGYDHVLNDVAAAGGSWTTCGDSLASYDCASDLGFLYPPSLTFLSPTSMPPNGTQTLYNTAGSITSPVSGSTLTWVAASYTYTVTAAPYNAANAAKTSSVAETDGIDFGEGSNTVAGASAVVSQLATETAAEASTTQAGSSAGSTAGSTGAAANTGSSTASSVGAATTSKSSAAGKNTVIGSGLAIGIVVAWVALL